MALLMGCTPPETIIETVMVPFTHKPLGMAPPDPLILHDVTIVTEGEYVKIDHGNYVNLLINMKLITNHIGSLNNRIEQCEIYYTQPLK